MDVAAPSQIHLFYSVKMATTCFYEQVPEENIDCITFLIRDHLYQTLTGPILSSYSVCDLWFSRGVLDRFRHKPEMQVTASLGSRQNERVK